MIEEEFLLSLEETSLQSQQVQQPTLNEVQEYFDSLLVHQDGLLRARGSIKGTFLINNRYASMLFDSGSDKSFVNTSLSHLIDIRPVRLNTSYEVKLADGRIVKLGTFDIVIGMDWLVEHDVVIVYGNKEVHILLKNEVLMVKGNKGVSRLKVISCIKARKCMEKEVFPDDLPRLPPPRQVEYRIDIMPRAAPVARAPYRLAPSEMKELSDQLKELSEKGFIRLSSSP
ncbi:putative reverse transcriptase domain-containing protein [Tanacetum coccineum]